MKRLIVNGDDLGLHPGINAGVAQCHREGILTSASLCPNGVAFADAVRELRELPDLDVGVHLTVVGGESPVSPPDRLPTLAPGGRLLPSVSVLFRALWTGRVRLGEIETEMSAQVARAQAAGVRITHLDSHQHVHLHPSVLPIVIGIARRFDVPWIRAARYVRPLRTIKATLLTFFSRAALVRVTGAGLRAPDTFVGAGESGQLHESRLLRLIAGLGPGTSELLCHPGVGREAIGAAYPDWGFQWDHEMAALTSPRAREALTRAGVQLTSYRDL